MKSSCIRQPQNNRYIQVCEWQVQFCQGNHCAAFVLSHFIAWHNWKLNHDEYYHRVNNIAESHGDGRPHDQNAYLFFSMDEISEGILGTYGKNTINNALQLLEELGAISIHKNPNPRYHFDKTKYFIFYPEVCNVWIEKSNSNNVQDESPEQFTQQPIDNSDRLKIKDRYSKIKSPSPEINSPSLKKERAITDPTNKTTNKDQSINKSEKVLDNNNFGRRAESIQPIVDALIAQGMPAKRFNHSDAFDAIQRLSQAGATMEIFLQAYEKAVSVADSSGFGVNYLVKVVEGVLAKGTQPSSGKSPILVPIQQPRVFVNDIPDDIDWIDGEI